MPPRNGEDELSAADGTTEQADREHAARPQALNDTQHGTGG
jgi:hypothetical protein